MLNLERLEMTPAGIERGELLATIPLAPSEQTSVVQKEWSVTSREFTSIVTDSLENYSENGVTENTELAQSTSSQIQHGNQFNISASVSGGCGFVTGSVTSSFGVQDATSRSATDSSKHALDTTRKASSRVKQEHKVTISSTTVTGTSETTTRTLQNPSATDPMRIDYFAMMRTWRVRLYRYGLRLTYDIAIPQPGGAMRELYMQLALLQAEAVKGFAFDRPYSDINEQNYLDLATQYGAQVAAPPDATLTQTIGGPIPGLSNDDSDTGQHFNQLPLNVPDGYAVSHVEMELFLSHANVTRHFYVFGAGPAEDLNANTSAASYDLTARSNFLTGAQGTQTITYFVQNAGNGAVTFTITQTLTKKARDQWIVGVWSALYNAAQTSFYARQQSVNAQIEALQAKITAVDTLTLRREESDEIMKGVLRWLLGTGFEFMPADVAALFGSKNDENLKYGVAFTGNNLGLPQAKAWTTMFQYEEMVKFINEAIEWENVLYFLYSYFWDVPQSWDFIRAIQHPDATRQAFLRAGSARVVLTVRKGYEEAWTSFVELGAFGTSLPGNHPYMAIAQEIAAYDDTNYPGIPAANPAGAPVNIQDSIAAASSDKLASSSAQVTLSLDSSTGMVVGGRVVIDTFESGVQELQTIVAVPDATHIAVKALTKAHDGSDTPFPVIQRGESGVLIAEWNEYTPTSGTDIAVTSNLATIA